MQRSWQLASRHTREIYGGFSIRLTYEKLAGIVGWLWRKGKRHAGQNDRAGPLRVIGPQLSVRGWR
jgi:hypothetical protein